MTKETIKTLFKLNKGKNFIITTDIACGHGINGVSYDRYFGLKSHYKEKYGKAHTYFQKTESIALMDECLCLTYSVDNEDWWGNGRRRIYIDYKNVCAIEFLEDTIDEKDIFAVMPCELDFEISY